MKKFRSNCPIASTLDLIGDKWTLLLVRDMLMGHKKTFKEFSNSAERIAPNILTVRLKQLEQFGIVTKQKLPTNKKENIYLLTKAGIALAPAIIDLAFWGSEYAKKYNDTIPTPKQLGFTSNKTQLVKKIRSDYLLMVNSL